MLSRPWIVLSLSLALAACQQKAEQAAPEPPAAPAASKPTPANQIEQAKAIARAHSEARGPAIARVQPDGGTSDQAPVGAVAEPTVDDLPPIVPFLKMNAHMTEVFAIMERNKDDCEKAAAEVEAYAAKNRPEMIALSKELNELAGVLSDEDKARFRAWTLRTGQQMIKQSMGVMMLFHQKCPEHMQRINAQVRTLSSPDKPAK